MDRGDLEMDELDLLIEEAAFYGELESPRDEWTEEEEQFLRESLGVLSLEEIASELGRSVNAVRVRRIRRGIPAPSKQPDWLTLQQIGYLLGVDPKTVAIWADRGYLRARTLPMVRRVRVAHRNAVLRFAINPNHWMMFDPNRVTDPYLRRLLERQAENWGDEWWSIGEVAAYHDVNHRLVNKYIHEGRLEAEQWGNWWVRRSVATAPDLIFYQGKSVGAAEQRAVASRSCDDFIILATAVGLNTQAIGKLTGKGGKYVDYRLRQMRRTGKLAEYASKLPISFDHETGQLWADWRRHQQRFPMLVAWLDRWAADDDLDQEKRLAVRSVLHVWAMWFAETPEDEELARRLGCGVLGNAGPLAAAYEQMRGQMEIDPLALPRIACTR